MIPDKKSGIKGAPIWGHWEVFFEGRSFREVEPAAPVAT